VGFQSVKSNVKASPLFTVRTKRAIDEKPIALSPNYLEKDKGIGIVLPTRDGRVELYQKVVDEINKMDDETFDGFIRKAVTYLHRERGIRNVKANEIITFFYQLRNNPKGLINNVNNGNDNFLAVYPECIVDWTVNNVWFPGYVILLCVFIVTAIAFFVWLQGFLAWIIANLLQLRCKIHGYKTLFP
ncbi:MAG: hypothetical protein JSW60_07760, partial [Thermoplasmatales archaeon]